MDRLLGMRTCIVLRTLFVAQRHHQLWFDLLSTVLDLNGLDIFAGYVVFAAM